jgi:tetratricopeptide (TPR) repeat protein
MVRAGKWSSIVVLIGLWAVLGECQQQGQEGLPPQGGDPRILYKQQAIALYEYDLALARQEQNREREVAALTTLGNAYQALRQYERAIAFHEQALAIHRELKDQTEEGRTLHHLGAVYEALSQGAHFSNSLKILVFSHNLIALSPYVSGRTPMMTLDDLCAHLLPPDDHITFQSLIIDEPRFVLVATMISANSTCPDCSQPTHRIHGHYPRTLADLLWATAPIELRLLVRRFRCCTCTCRRKTFAERLPRVAPRYARTTTRLATTQANTGLALGGAAGARHLARHGLPGSRNTLLRRVRSVSLPKGPEPEIIGLDDWAWRRGNCYGTIMVDLQRGCTIDVLEDRAAEPVATWLKSQPDVKIVARDRAEAYAAGIRQGAPDATQVADRFHLLKNVAAALQEVFSAHHREIDQLNHLPHHAPLPQDADSVTVPPEAPVTMTVSGILKLRSNGQVEMIV